MVILNLVMALYLLAAAVLMSFAEGDSQKAVWPCVAAAGVAFTFAGAWWWYKDRDKTR